MVTPEEAKKKAAATYNAAADTYDHPANTFWDRYGRRTVDRLNLAPGARVLDVCCGSGASAIPAAAAVGPTGSVLGVDLADNLLALARDKAKARGLTNTEFRTGDMLDLGLPDAEFDAVICVFGIFFVPRFNPWDRIVEPEAVRALLTSAGVKDPVATAEAGAQLVNTPADWWPMVRGSGYRGTIEQLTPEQRDKVRLDCESFIEKRQIRSLEANVVYAVATRD